jgi:D-tyrosyl-tRNA(Tyr) deacylase
MRALLQRVTRARVTIAGETVGTVGRGLVVLAAAGRDDGDADVAWTAGKIVRLRVFPDERGRMNRSVADAGGGVLLVSQFTLYGDASRGNRPSFTAAAEPDAGERLIDALAAAIAGHDVDTQTGRFGAYMEVELVNDGPVTIWLDSRR